MSQKIRIKLKSYDHKLVDKSAEKIVKAVKATGAIVSGPIPLPTHKRIYTVNRSTFVNKKSREQFQLSDFKRLIDIYSSTAKTVDALMKLELPSGVEVEIIAAHRLYGCALHGQVDLAGLDDAVGLLEVGFRLLNKVVVAVGGAPLQQHGLIILAVCRVRSSQFQHGAEGSVLGHVAHAPHTAVVVDRDAVRAGIVGVRCRGGLPVHQQGEHHVGCNAQTDENGHCRQQPGTAALRRRSAVDLIWHGCILLVLARQLCAAHILYSIPQPQRDL